MAAPRLTHLDPDGNPRMVDTSAKAETERVAVAEGWVRMSPEALVVIQEGRAAKGDVLWNCDRFRPDSHAVQRRHGAAWHTTHLPR